MTDPIFTNEELPMVIKSLSITYDVLIAKLDRTTGRHHNDAMEEFTRVNSALAKCREAQTQRMEKQSA